MTTSKVPWGEKMRNLMEFIEAHTVNLWKPYPEREGFVYAGPNVRYRITRERQPSVYENSEAYQKKGILEDIYRVDSARYDYLEERGINVSTEDSLQFARDLEKTLWQHTSYNNRRYIIAVLMEMQREDDKYREGPDYVPDPVASEEEIRPDSSVGRAVD